MRQSSWMKADIFRRIPKDLTEATVSGAIISILCVVVMLILFTGEVISYVFPRTQSDMMVDNDKTGSDRLKVFIDMDLYRLPCGYVSVDIADLLKNHEVDSSTNLRKIPLTPKGDEIPNRMNPDEIVERNEGCRLRGFIFVNKVPGNFHISSHSRSDRAMQDFPEGIWLEHTIRTLSFEPEQATGAYRYPEAGSRPLEGTVSRITKPTSFHYFLDVVPTVYSGAVSTLRTYQYTVGGKQVPPMRGHMPVLMFSYQLSPIVVQYSSARVSFTHFLTYICAIIGGVYTVSGLISRFVYNSTAQIQKKFLGKGD